eukprot:1302572-Pleurochrysis_carterae.AAC.1
MTIVRAVCAELDLDQTRSNAVAANPMRQQPFLQQLLEKLETPAGAKQVVHDLCRCDQGCPRCHSRFRFVNGVLLKLADLRRRLRSELAQPGIMQLFFAGNVLMLSQPFEQLVAAFTPPELCVQVDEGAAAAAGAFAAATEPSVAAADAGERAVAAPARGVVTSSI